jgi:hypothetical protein
MRQFVERSLIGKSRGDSELGIGSMLSAGSPWFSSVTGAKVLHGPLPSIPEGDVQRSLADTLHSN